MPRKRQDEATVGPRKGLNLDPELIKQRVPGTLDRATINAHPAALKKANFEHALCCALTHHLDYEKDETKPVGGTNHRNGSSRKRIATDDDLLDVEIPRDREGTFDPVLIAKSERCFTGFGVDARQHAGVLRIERSGGTRRAGTEWSITK